jgi:hypothetical protein
MMVEYTAEKNQIRCAGYPFAGAYIAGGALTSVFTGKPINDVDFYFKSRAHFEEAIFQCYEEGFWCVATSKRAVTFKDGDHTYQLMYFDFFPTAGDIFKAFDFTACMGAVDLDADELILHDDFMKHNSQRFLRFNHGTRYPLASATRVLKYQSRGYTIGKGDILKIALACRGVKIDSWDDLKDQIGGAYGDKVELAGEEQEFNLENAIASLTVDADGKDVFIRKGNESQPGDAESLLRKIAEINGVEFVPPTLDRDGWPMSVAELREAA